ncbi:b(o/a)3-type cytochrome-c oxidase subunit 1 [Deinococcus soli (ex Cha et al. 2016)]|uniref:b(o/a)3-type cytochrome-c oxidase subunit 1 n=1 Tax=Deinococcus soli (ex Cha et al. 2016) TaxID=1309411 RepID=UPI00166BD27D|nr:b(o/a)3-type cytochrome-c oxidase subunit 1 [Deinococcus soli (ex Cha et al. 2016)]GGB53971.1 cytochrome c oxidase subunit 1 [Deinococcus soli (ex Cha et al. 2016)]
MTTALPSKSAPSAALPGLDAATLSSLKKLTQYYAVTAFIALMIGVLLGPLQALNYGGINVYDYPLLKVLIKSYYQGLTLHGVLNALVFTQFFISGWMLYLPVRDLNVRPNMRFAWFTYLMMTAGLLTAAVPLLTNDATVLYTFYPPLEGSPVFYIGAAVMVAASLLVAGQVVWLWLAWKRAHPGRVTPVVTYMSVATWLMWVVAALGLVVEVVAMLIPWSLGLTRGVDPLLARTLFWWTGHPIVYFWLLPAYISWYAFLPRQAGGRMASEGLTRLAFAMFLVFSVPVGLHHQYADPNVQNSWKIIHMFLTFLVAVPSLLTAFSAAASLEDAARARGGRGLIGWVRRLPWGNASMTAQVLAMVSFIFGGAGGIVNASMAFSPVVHNTAWIPGHFHITVGTATTLTFMGVMFWLVPHLTGKRLASPRTALASVWWWFTGMMLFALGMHWQGLAGVPRRALVSASAQQGVYDAMHLGLPKMITAASGGVLFIAAILFYTVLWRTLLSRRVDDPESTPIPRSDAISAAGETLQGASPLVRRTEPLLALTFVALVLVILVYGPVIAPMLTNYQFIPGQRLW